MPAVIKRLRRVSKMSIDFACWGLGWNWSAEKQEKLRHFMNFMFEESERDGNSSTYITQIGQRNLYIDMFA